LVLSFSAGAMLWRRRLFPIIGGGFTALMGALVILQYAAGITLGVDTFFFFPWEQTLSAHPGRMALTSAISFTIAGIALILFAQQRTLGIFAIAHTLPLSLGLTSLLGYLFGITYVLPFHLGSQMAVHTAFAFALYSAAMLVYAWRHILQTQEGLPKWTPAMAVVMVPVFFVSLSSTLQNHSLSARVVQFVLALAGMALLAFALHKIMRARIVYKGLILISVPLFFVLGFVLLVNQQKRTGEEVQVKALHSKEVITHTYALTENLVDAQSSIRGYVITLDENYLEPYKQAVLQIPEVTKQLKALSSDNAQQLARVENLVAKATERMGVLEKVKTLVDEGQQEEAIAQIKSGTGKLLMDEFRSLKDVFLDEEERLDEARRKDVQDSWQQFDWLLVGGASADILLALTLAFLFTRGIGLRIQTLTENSQALADGKRLAPPLTGTDEIAKLDQTFHRMAQALRSAHDELESKVEERTKELLQATEEIKKLNEDLEKRVIERTEQLQAANKELEAFSYSVSHDLRTPLRAIDGFSRIFIEDYADKLDDEGRRVLDVIRTNAQNMGQLIDDLLAFSRLGRKQIEPAVIDMRELAQDVYTELKPNFISQTQNLRIEQLPAAKGDRALLRQVFVNLISNAVKYSGTKEDAPIEVGGRTENGENIYYVRDSGVGFDMKYADKLFGVFQRLHSVEE
ncbi:MAG TPA: CHASE3 domain-containing protein, partial [Pyrinomonadaceae bacterium]|nr:CHASE3 domain-containing protein [Pyrinomonadaceae bacterium]